MARFKSDIFTKILISIYIYCMKDSEIKIQMSGFLYGENLIRNVDLS